MCTIGLIKAARIYSGSCGTMTLLFRAMGRNIWKGVKERDEGILSYMRSGYGILV